MLTWDDICIGLEAKYDEPLARLLINGFTRTKARLIEELALKDGKKGGGEKRSLS